MKTMLTLIAVSLLVAGPTSAQSRLDFECEGGIEFWASFAKDGRRAVLHYGDEIFELPRQRGASGERFAAEGISLWLKGNEATLELADGNRFGPCGERAALGLDEMELLKLPVRSSRELETAWFNDHLESAAARGETWVLDAKEVALRFIDSPESPYLSVTCAGRPVEGPRRCEVTVVKGWLADDSVSAVWHRIDLEREGLSRWQLVGAQRAYLCQRGRQTQFYAADLCP